MVQKIQKNKHGLSSKEFMKAYLALKYPVDHTHIQLRKGFVDFVLGIVLGVMLTIIFIS